MVRALLLLLCSAASLTAAAGQSTSSLPSFDYEAARSHEIKPHRQNVPIDGLTFGSNQLHLKLTVSPTGEVVQSEASGQESDMRFWPQAQDVVNRWSFTPFEVDGKAVTAQVEEYINLVPPERTPAKHVEPPVLRPNSSISIELSRSGCYGTCPAYKVSVSTSGVAFDGEGFTVASGHHIGKVDPTEVRELARQFVEADFFSMEDEYAASITDSPTYILSVSIDGRQKRVLDYVGVRAGMPEEISDLEEAVDELAHSSYWTEGDEGLVDLLKAEHYPFRTLEAQVMLKAAASRGQAATVRELLAVGVPLKTLPAPKPKDASQRSTFHEPEWLESAATHSETLAALIDAGASKENQKDKDQALVAAVTAGNLDSFHELISYGANPRVDPGTLTITEGGGGMYMQGPGRGSLLIYAAASGNPDLVREVLQYHPNLEARDPQGQTALFSAGNSRPSDRDGDRVECVRLLIASGANVNARDAQGNTALHETFLTDVLEELLRSGANVNARNNDGETPIFTTFDDAAIPVFIEHGADLNIRNDKGQTVLEAAESKGPLRQEALRKALQKRETIQPNGTDSSR